MFQLVDRPIDLAALDRAVRDAKAGAIVTFVGTTRNENAGRQVRRLEYEAFEACHWLIDRLKEIVPIWKKEHYRGGEVWIGAQQGGPPARRGR